MSAASPLPLPEGRYVGQMTTEAAFGGLSARSAAPPSARTSISPRNSFVNPAVDANARRVAVSAEVPCVRPIDVQWSEEEELMSPVEKLIIIEDRIEMLRKISAEDVHTLTSINELLIVAMALTRLAHGDAGITFARVLYQLATSYMDLKMYTQAVPHLKQSLSLLDMLDVADLQKDSQLLQPYMSLRLGVCLFHVGSLPKAVKVLQKALRRHHALQGEEHVEGYYFYVALAKVYSAQNEFSKAEECLQSAWAVKDHFLGRNHGFDEELAQVHVERAKICQKKVAMVENVLKRTKEEAVPDSHLEQAAQLQKGVPRYVSKQRQLALKAYRQAHEMYAASPDLSVEMSLRSANVAYQIGHLLWHLDQAEAAYHWLERSAKVYAKHRGLEDHHTLHLMKDCILVVLKFPPRAEPAMFAHSIMVDLPDKAEGGNRPPTSPLRENPPDLAASQDSDTLWFDMSADGLCEFGPVRLPSTIDPPPIRFGEMDADNGLLKLKSLLALEQRAFGRSSPQVAYTFSLMGDCHAERQEFSRAVVMYERARSVFQSYFGASHEKTISAKAKWADAQAKARNAPD
eukprot:GGOE01018644.1.p1 GENE.GGOE01018644.1~~GGOE01018644.1.p1  ORF type:complete len:573 (+),score=178.04 GGOE01018644.1:112-1830(+)